MSKKEKKDKNANETVEKPKSFFIVHQKLIRENQNQRLKKVLQRE